MVEEWRATHHPHYEVSNLGRVRSCAPRGGDVRKGKPTVPTIPRILKPGATSTGYPSVAFGRKHGSQNVHVLVAVAFLGPIPPKQEVRHKDDNPANARADNLEYGTRTQNILDAVERGRWSHSKKLTSEQVLAIRDRALTESQASLAREYRVCHAAVWAIVHRRTWRHV